VYAAAWLTGCALLLQLKLEPYKEPLFNTLEALSIGASFVTQQLSLLYWVHEDHAAFATWSLIGLNGAVAAAFAGALVYKLEPLAFFRRWRRREAGGGGGGPAAGAKGGGGGLAGVEIEMMRGGGGGGGEERGVLDVDSGLAGDGGIRVVGRGGAIEDRGRKRGSKRGSENPSLRRLRLSGRGGEGGGGAGRGAPPPPATRPDSFRTAFF